MENIKHILIQKPIFDAVIANTKDHEDKVNFSKAVDMFDDLFLIANKYFGLRTYILTTHAESLSHNILLDLSENDWKIISGCKRFMSDYDCLLSVSFIEKYSEKIDWGILSTSYRLSDSTIQQFTDKVDWKKISKYEDLTPDFIEEFADRLNWHNLSEYSVLTEDLIRKFESKVDWKLISEYQDLSEEFILEFSHKINFLALLRSEYAPGDVFIAYLLERAYH